MIIQKILKVSAVAVPVVVAIVFIALFVSSSSQLSTSKDGLAALQGASTQAISDKDGEISAQATSAEATRSEVLGEAQATISAEETQKKDLLDKYSDTRIELDEIKKSVFCVTQMTKVDFTNNSTVSKDLVALVGDIDGSNLIANWDVVWNNVRTAIHKITGEYLWVFIVTFDDPEFGMTNSIFSMTDMCFLFRSSPE